MEPTPMPAEATQPGVHLTHRQILLVFSGLMLGMFLAALDQTIVSAALPTIAADLGGFDQITWVVTSYLLTSTVTILLWGKLSDIFGRKVMFQTSIATFVAASALIGLSPNMAFLIVGRGLQGIGAGGIMSLAFAIVGDILSPRERGKYMGLMGAVFLLSSVVGPLLGGLIVDHASWRWVFYVNVPLGIPALVLTGVVLHLPFRRVPQRIDYAGATLMTVGASMLILGLVWGGSPAPWDGTYTLRWLPGVGAGGAGPAAGSLALFLGDWLVSLLVAGGLLVSAAFVWVESRIGNPLLPVSLFRKAAFTIPSLVSFVIGAAMFGGFVFLPTYLQISTGVSATMSGLMLLPMIAGLMPMSTLSGFLITRTGRYKWWPLAGLPVAAAGMALLSRLTADSSQLYVGVGMFLLGAGIGMTMQVMVLAVQNALPATQMGIGTASNNFVRSMGSVIGVSVFGAFFNQEVRAALSELARRGSDPSVVAGILRSSPEKIHALPPEVRDVVTAHVAAGVADIFLYAIPLVAVAWLLLLFLKEVPLRTTRHLGAAAAEAVLTTAAEETVPVAPPPPLLPGAVAPARAPLWGPGAAAAGTQDRRTPPPMSKAELGRLHERVDRAIRRRGRV